VIIPYTYVGIARLHGLGWEIVDGQSVATAVTMGSIYYSAFGFTTGLAMVTTPELRWLLNVGVMVVTACELSSLAIMRSRRFRIVWLLVMTGFHLGTLILMNIFFWENAILLWVLFWPTGAHPVPGIQSAKTIRNDRSAVVTS
jgi:hypothetical protein